jgi:hypothetical protein
MSKGSESEGGDKPNELGDFLRFGSEPSVFVHALMDLDFEPLGDLLGDLLNLFTG